MTDIQRYFASYSTADRRLVEPIVRILRTTKAAVFLAHDSITPGEKWEEVLAQRLKSADTLVLFWSRNAQESEWVTTEWKTAARTGKRILPVLIDQTPLPAPLATFQWIDFRYLADRRRLMARIVIACVTLIILQFAAYPLFLLMAQPREADQIVASDFTPRLPSAIEDHPIHESPPMRDALPMPESIPMPEADALPMSRASSMSEANRRPEPDPMLETLPMPETSPQPGLLGYFLFFLFISSLIFLAIMLFLSFRQNAQASTVVAEQIDASLTSV